MPEPLKLPIGLWRREAIVKLIKRELGVIIAKRTMGDLSKKVWIYSTKAKAERI